MNLLPDFLTLGRPSCTGNPDLFTTATPANVQKAKAICATCPLLLACQSWAITTREPVGVWGGLSPSERAQLRNGPGWWCDDEGRDRLPCGTVEALGAHRGYGETCANCEAAEEARTTAGRRDALEREHAKPRGGSSRGYDLHQLLGEEPCPQCLTMQRARWASNATKSRRAQRSRSAAARPGPMALAS